MTKIHSLRKLETATAALCEELAAIALAACDNRDIYIVHSIVNEIRRADQLPRRVERSINLWRSPT